MIFSLYFKGTVAYSAITFVGEAELEVAAENRLRKAAGDL